jgi:hypothetical protein
MSDFCPETGSTQAWNAAYYRLEDYLRAHAVTDRIHQAQIILPLLQRATARHATDPSQDPTRLAMEEIQRELDQWFQRVLPEENMPSARLNNLARASLYIVNATQRWPRIFLTPDPLPPDFLEAMQKASFQSGPDLNVSTMVPRHPDETSPVKLIEKTFQSFLSTFLAGIAGAVIIGVITAYFTRSVF